MNPPALAPEPVSYNAGRQSHRDQTIALLGLRVECLSLLPGRSPQAIIRELQQLQSLLREQP